MHRPFAIALCSLYVPNMRSKRPAKLSELEHARLVEQARVFCGNLNDLSSRVSPSADDYWVLHDLNAAVLSTIEKLTGRPAPWIVPTSAASYPGDRKD